MQGYSLTKFDKLGISSIHTHLNGKQKKGGEKSHHDQPIKETMGIPFNIKQHIHPLIHPTIHPFIHLSIHPSIHPLNKYLNTYYTLDI